MDHEDARGALARALLIFVGPAAVVGHCLAAKIALAAFKVRIVDEDDHDLPAQAFAFEIVPVAFGRPYSIADEHQRYGVEIDCTRAIGRGTRGDLLALR